MAKAASPGKSPATWCAVAVLLIIAIGGTLCVPIYARTLPKLGPFPFFYWFQLIWVPLTSALCWISYLLLRKKPFADARPASPASPAGTPGRQTARVR